MKSPRIRIPISEIDPRQALHELQAYHEELELQNKELQHIREQNEYLIQKYTTLYDQAPTGYLTLDRFGKIIELNLVALNYLRHGYDYLLNSDLRQYISTDALPVFNDFFRNIFEKQSKVSCNAVLSIPGNNPVSIQFEGISIENGLYCLVTMTDVTQLKQTEEALNLSRKEFQSYFENGSVGLSVSSPGRGWIELNQKFCQMLGYTKDELIGINWMELSHPDDLQANLVLYNQAMEGKIDRYQMDKRFIRKDGEILFVTLSVACQRNQDGTLHHLLSSYIDITDHKLTEIALQNSEEKYRTTLEMAPDVIFQADKYGNFILVNDKAVKFTGYSKEEFFSMKATVLFSPEELKKQPFRFDLADKGEIIVFERELIKKDGSTAFVETNSKMMPDHTYLCLMKDVTKRKLDEETLKASEERYRSLFDSFPDAIILADVKSGLIIDANPSASKLTGRGVNDLIGMHHTRLYPLRDEELAGNAFKERSKNITKSTVQSSRRIILNSKGEEIPVDLLSKVISINKKSVLEGIFRKIQNT
jgi:PAS domain S-box-containing protein